MELKYPGSDSDDPNFRKNMSTKNALERRKTPILVVEALIGHLLRSLHSNAPEWREMTPVQ